MGRSFRFKVGLLSAALSGVLLVGLAVYALGMIKKVGRDRIDGELRALADAQVRKVQPPGHWRRFDESLRSFYGADSGKKFVVVATRPEGELLFASSPWPGTLKRETLPLPLGGIPAHEDATHPPPPDDTPPPRDDDARGPHRSPPRPLQVAGPLFATLATPEGEWRAMTLANEDVVLSLALSLAPLESEMRRVRRALLVSIPLGLLLIVTGGWLVGNLALRPVRRLADAMESVTARRLSARLPEQDADLEFRRLIALFNAMLERLERSFHQATRFSADAAHELKTPLAILQAQLERSLQHARDGSPEQRDAADQLDEIQRLRGILRKLLLLAQADAGKLPLSPETFDLAVMLRGAADDVVCLATDRQVSVQAPDHLPVTGDPGLLKQVLDNLVSNAVKFGTPGGQVDFTLAHASGAVHLDVSNTGPDIPTAEHGLIFERFYRADKSHGRSIEGSGLGLSLAREIARAHGGELALTSSTGGRTTFSLRLPSRVDGEREA